MRAQIQKWIQGDYTWWIVTLPCAGSLHDQRIVDWCQDQFGYVDKGVIKVAISQDFWFEQEHEAISCWLTWGGA